MSEFARTLKNIKALESAAESWPQWWKDLLSLWRPSGVDSGDYGLRLAIRNNYMNFYRRGQSVARVVINSKGVPTASIHFKYLFKNADVPKGQDYIKLQGEYILLGAESRKQYEGIDDLKKWISVINGDHIDAGYSGDEKKFVDLLVSANPGVIDLEVGIPAWGDQKSAPRMDLVIIKGVVLFFWKLKLSMISVFEPVLHLYWVRRQRYWSNWKSTVSFLTMRKRVTSTSS